jgi:aminopeptidase YwaD
MTSHAEMLASTHLHALCDVSPDRRPGSPGNEQAAGYVAAEMRSAGWTVTEPSFDVLDWTGSPGHVFVGRRQWPVTPSPYATGAEVTRRLVVARALDDLGDDLRGQVVLLMDELAAEPLTPIDYPFYDNPEHTTLIDRLIAAKPRVVLAGTGTAPQTAGALDPFPLIEDGAFPIATGNLCLHDAHELAEHAGDQVRVDLSAHRWPARAHNVIARRGPASPRLLVVAHLDSKPGTPGAVDNAAGVVVLLLLARALAGTVEEDMGVELLAVNGEDCYHPAGQLAYLREHGDHLDEVALAVNIDGAGLRAAGTAYSLYGVSEDLADAVRGALADASRIDEGPAWFQSDHMVFAQRGVPAVAFTTEKLDDLLAEVAHSPHDVPAQVDVTLLTDLSAALAGLVQAVRDHVTDPASAT